MDDNTPSDEYDMLPPAKKGRKGEIAVEFQPTPPVVQLNQYIQEIINGQVDVTVDPEVAATSARQTLGTLFDELQQIITEKETDARRRVNEIQQENAAAMARAEEETLIEENARMLEQINNAMIRAQDGRLNRQQRLLLNDRIMILISNSVTEAEIQRELNRDPTGRNIRGLYDALIQYYTEIASYGYQRSPQVLSNIGSILGGTAMIGAAVIGGGSSGTPGGILMMLAQFLGTATITASGLYLLQRGGLNIQGFLQGTGAATRQCILTGCQKIAEYGEQGLTLLMNEAGSRLNMLFHEQPDDSQSSYRSIDSSSYSSYSSYSTASSASTAIKSILNTSIEFSTKTPEQQVVILEGEVPPDEPLTQSDYGDIDGGRKRKSRRHTKSKNSRKGRKGRNGRMTKKGRKHHKTMKRYRSKMRR